jgi:hypothetical protein
MKLPSPPRTATTEAPTAPKAPEATATEPAASKTAPTETTASKAASSAPTAEENRQDDGCHALPATPPTPTAPAPPAAASASPVAQNEEEDDQNDDDEKAVGRASLWRSAFGKLRHLARELKIEVPGILLSDGGDSEEDSGSEITFPEGREHVVVLDSPRLTCRDEGVGDISELEPHLTLRGYDEDDGARVSPWVAGFSGRAHPPFTADLQGDLVARSALER